MKTNDAGVALIERAEGLRLEPYQDAVGKWTVGYGHVVLSHESDLMGGIDEAEAEVLLRADLAIAESAVLRRVTVPLNPNQFSALVSWTFNLGEGNLRASTLLKLLNESRFEEAAEEFPRWNRAGGRPLPGLTARRLAEQKLFLTPVPHPASGAH